MNVAAAARRRSRRQAMQEGVLMEFQVGDRVIAESESTQRAPRRGVVEEIVRANPRPRLRIRWDDGHESVYAPADGALRVEESTAPPS
jgi:hypothetical protein